MQNIADYTSYSDAFQTGLMLKIISITNGVFFLNSEKSATPTQLFFFFSYVSSE